MPNSIADTEGGPGALDALKRKHAEVLSLVDAHAPPHRIAECADALLDYDWLVEHTLAADRRRDQARGLLVELIRRDYLEHLTSRGRGDVEYLREHPIEGTVRVETRVRITDIGKTRIIEIDYVTRRTFGEWRVRDVVTEGVSLAKNYKYEISRLSASGGTDGVIAGLQRRLKEQSGQVDGP